MFRLVFGILRWLILVAVVVWATVKLSANDDVVSVGWAGAKYSAPLWLAIVALVLLVIVCIMLYALYRELMDAPGKLRAKAHKAKTESGYKALSTGMVALAAGDADEAKASAVRADRLLKSPPITNLLAAQSAQLKGDERAARRFFAEMLKDEETKFLGLRGLINQGLRDGRTAEALQLVREAHKMNPESKWVLEALFELETRSGNMPEAQAVVKQQRSLSYISSDVSRQRQAVLMIEKAKSELENAGTEDAVKTARLATRLDPDSTAGARIKAKALMAAGGSVEAQKTIRKAWSKMPQEELVALYLEASGATGTAARAKALRTLAKSNKNAALSNLLLAELAIAEKSWDAAKSYLLKAEEAGPTERGYKLMAQVEQAQSNDSALVQEHLMKAIDAKGEGRWTCGSCGSQHEEWSALCGDCNAFGLIAWKQDEGKKSARALINPTAPLLPPDEKAEEGRIIDSGTGAGTGDKPVTVLGGPGKGADTKEPVKKDPDTKNTAKKDTGISDATLLKT